MRTILNLTVASSLMIASTALAQTSPVSNGILGMAVADAKAKLGSPTKTYAEHPAVDAHCVRGKGIDGNTFGPCDKDRESIFTRYDNNVLAAVMYVTSHGNARDRSWMQVLDRAIAGIEPASNPSKLSNVSHPRPLSAFRYQNGATVVYVEPVPSFIVVIWYPRDVAPDLSREPLMPRKVPVICHPCGVGGSLAFSSNAE